MFLGSHGDSAILFRLNTDCLFIRDFLAYPPTWNLRSVCGPRSTSTLLFTNPAYWHHHQRLDHLESSALQTDLPRVLVHQVERISRELGSSSTLSLHEVGVVWTWHQHGQSTLYCSTMVIFDIRHISQTKS